MKFMEKKHAVLVTEFDRYVVDHSEFAEKIPRNAQIILQIAGDTEYNEWSVKTAEKQREPGQPVVFITVKGLKPVKSRIINPRVAVAAA